MNRTGHIIIAFIFIILSYFILGYFFKISPLIFQFAFSFVFGNLLPDLIEVGGKNLWNHRGVIHSKGFTKILFFFVMPISIFIALETSQVYFHITSLILGICLHNGIDSFTQRGWGRF